MRRLFFLLLLLPGFSTAAQWQSLEEIQAAAERYASRLNADAAREYSAGMLDARLRLRDCSGRLEPFLPQGTRAGANMTVGVRCLGQVAWRVFVPVRSRMTGQVVVARRALPRGHSLTAADLELAEFDLDRLPYGYLTEANVATGQVLRRPVAPGAVLIPGMLQSARAVRRGQSITLFADTGGGVQIQMAGKALADGALRQRIRVENASSGRVLEGVVRSAERVEILVN
ncbi:MAG: flagellar basal body P-ring formation protein FlgA [Gammaproteobacteria bacterium]|nr:flagellar basal body P-ring formation protein FlgA [Gammaproteobacteria bacterium]NNF61192.1 flagellar basal body P-ring formation protein FlgA [Gammaproteobacteria bacterium]NNM19941.1 flagellar basal body P-ring formation protein FlgA [Gammaproteobacteria bacterium]